MSSYRAAAFWGNGWTGQVELDTVNTTAPDAHTSVAQLLAAVQTLGRLSIDPAFTWSLTSSGLVRLTSPTVFDLTFAGNAGTRLGFTSGPWTGAGTYTADTVAHGLWAPFAHHALSVWADIRVPDGQGVRTYAAGAMGYCPGTAWRRPRVEAECGRDGVLALQAAAAVVAAPTQVDLIDADLALVTYHLGRVSVREIDPTDGWAAVELEVARG